MKTLVKICGLTRPEDARKAFELGADYGGVIGYPGSPRYVSSGEVSPLLAEIPAGKRVWVGVEPDERAIQQALDAGFDFFQIHFDPEGGYDPKHVTGSLDRSQVWIAPRLQDPLKFREEWASFGSLVLIDGFSKDRMGGTGKRVDGSSYSELTKKFPEIFFALAGGVRPDNVGEALRESRAKQIDVSSGIESSPGVKVASEMEGLFEAIQRFESGSTL